MKSYAYAVLLVAAGCLVTGCEDKASTTAPAIAEQSPTKAGAANPGADGPKANAMRPDGLPAVIPTEKSKPPTVAEWNDVEKEVTVTGSTALGCETKMLREWLRVSCHPKNGKTPRSAETKESGGQQAFTGLFGTTASVVVEIVKGKDYRAVFTWDDGSDSTLVVDWASDAERPKFSFVD